MRTGIHTLRELFSDRHLNRLIIPEFQRDYVWQNEQVNCLLDSLVQGFEGWQKRNESLPFEINGLTDSAPLEEVRKDFMEFHAKRVHSRNIGFVYAYTDPGLPGDYFLIDGQQRLTTLFLTLTIVASMGGEGESLRNRFIDRYFPGLKQNADDLLMTAAQPRLDYRLREYTTFFFRKFIHWILFPKDGKLEDQTWYLKRVQEKADVTVTNLVENQKTIHTHLQEKEWDEEDLARFFEYLENFVELWYFDTNESDQGEELYLFLNARGKSLETHETDKADLLKDLSSQQEKETWGQKWEEWQDVFWRNRSAGEKGKTESKNPDADRGFNAFLAAVKRMHSLLGHEWEMQNGLDKLQWIEHAMVDLQSLGLDESTQETGASYPDWPWLKEWQSKFWNILNNEKPVSFDESDPSVLLICGSLLAARLGREHKVETKTILRAIRLIYLRFFNQEKVDAGLPERVELFLRDCDSLAGPDADFEPNAALNEEERSKLVFLSNLDPNQRDAFERIIWEIEDHPLNLDGSGLDGSHYSHLLDLRTQPDKERLEKTRAYFDILFPRHAKNKEKALPKLKDCLFHYGKYWEIESPWTYRNFNFGNWRRTIRGKGRYEKEEETSSFFKRFFDEFLETDGNLDQFLQTKNEKNPAPEPSIKSTELEALRWYSQKLGNNLWTNGDYIAIQYTTKRRDKVFSSLGGFWNTGGSFRGSKPEWRLSERLEPELKSKYAKTHNESE